MSVLAGMITEHYYLLPPAVSRGCVDVYGCRLDAPEGRNTLLGQFSGCFGILLLARGNLVAHMEKILPLARYLRYTRNAHQVMLE